MKRLFVLLGLLVTVLMLSATVTIAAGKFEERHGAYSSSPGMQSMSCGNEFKSMDADGDGALNWSEYSAAYDGVGYAGTIPSHSGTPAFLAFGNKDNNDDRHLTAKEFCAG